MKSRLTSVSALALAAVLLAGPAFASPFQLDPGPGFTSNDLQGPIDYTGSPAVHDGGVFIGPLNMNVTDLATSTTTTQSVYCTDIFDNFNGGEQYILSTTSLASRIGVDGTTKVNQINALLTNATPSTLAEAAAVQAAIWEIINEPGTSGYSVTTGLFTTSVTTQQSDFTTAIQNYLTNVTGGGANWQADPSNVVKEYILDPSKTQNPDQSFGFLEIGGGGHEIPTPEPTTLSLLGLGVIGMAAARRSRARRRRA